jgi:CRP-like cAMP-binding protein
MHSTGDALATPQETPIDALVRACGISPEAAAALRTLSVDVERYPAGSVVRPKGSAPELKWLASGWACELRVLADGRRQIFSFALPGDVATARMVGVNGPCALVAITPLDCLDVGRTLDRLDRRVRDELRNAVVSALELGLQRRYLEISRLTYGSSVLRVANLLLELRDRLDLVGLVEASGFVLPLTRQHLADALGLSGHRVRRSLVSLHQSGLVTLGPGKVTEFARDRVEEICRMRA